MGARGVREEDLPDLWERQPGETVRQYEQFCTYRDSGRGRTLAKVAEVLKRSPGWIRSVAAEGDWVRRAAAWDAEMDRVLALALIDRRREMNERQARLATVFQAKIADRLRTLKVADLGPVELARWLEVATKVERQALGEPTEHVKHTGAGGGPIEHALLTDDERRARLVELSAEVQRRLGDGAA